MNVQVNMKKEDGSYEDIFFKNNESNVYGSDGKSIEGKYVKKTGDTMTGNLGCSVFDSINRGTNRVASFFFKRSKRHNYQQLQRLE